MPVRSLLISFQVQLKCLKLSKSLLDSFSLADNKLYIFGAYR